MPTYYEYPLWNGREVVGTYKSLFRLLGSNLRVATIPTLKRPYRLSKFEEIRVPIIDRLISDDGVRYMIERSLDVRKKSKRQIEILLRGSTI